MSGRETVAYVGSLHPAEARPSKARIQEVIDLVGIADAADRPSKTYSGGMRPIRRPYRYAVDGTSDDDDLPRKRVGSSPACAFPSKRSWT